MDLGEYKDYIEIGAAFGGFFVGVELADIQYLAQQKTLSTQGPLLVSEFIMRLTGIAVTVGGQTAGTLSGCPPGKPCYKGISKIFNIGLYAVIIIEVAKAAGLLKRNNVIMNTLEYFLGGFAVGQIFDPPYSSPPPQAAYYEPQVDYVPQVYTPEERINELNSRWGV